MKRFNLFLIIALSLIVAACATNSAVVKTSAEMIAEEIGIAVAKNNPGLLPQVKKYAAEMHALKDAGDAENLSILANYGINYILQKYTGDDLTSKRIASNVRRLMELSGFDPSQLVTPEADEIATLAMDYIMGVVDAFVGGMEMV